jgi:ABC-type transport system involved in multi-copper enzyme maturation permease subunit
MNDFSERLSPIVVKELRQGMRSKGFVTLFLLLQTFMIFCIIAALGEGARSGASTFFWTVVGFTLMIGMPLRGVFSISSEIKENTLDLILLTELSAWRIMAGKWAALFLQSLLLVCAILPYVVIRYFFGGVDLASELVILRNLFWLGTLLTALAVGLSPFMQSLVGRIFLAVGGVAAAWFSLFLLVSSMMPRMGGMPTPSYQTQILLFLAVSPFLELGIVRISPMGENHAFRKRLLALAGVAFCGILGAIFGERAFLAWLAVGLAAPVCLAGVLEENLAVPGLYKPLWPFKRPSFLSRLIGRLFYPGWTTAVPFSMVVATAILWISPYGLDSAEKNCLILSALGILWLPLGVLRTIRRDGPIFTGFLYSQLLCFVLAIVLSSTARYAIGFGMLLPTTGFFMNLWSRHPHEASTAEAIVAGFMVLVSLTLCLVASIQEWRAIAQLERKAQEPI